MAKNIEINYKNEGGYEVLYPNVQTASVLDIGNFYYNKTEVDEKIQNGVNYIESIGLKKTLICDHAQFSGTMTLIGTNINLFSIVGFYGKFYNVNWYNNNSCYIQGDVRAIQDSLALYVVSYSYSSEIIGQFDFMLIKTKLIDNNAAKGFQFSTTTAGANEHPAYIYSNNLSSSSLYLEGMGTGELTLYSLTY